MATENWRPQFHLSPRSGWMNDPCGLVTRRGDTGRECHLYFQHVPLEPGGKPDFDPARLHWGHAVSPDFVRWRRLDPALAPDDLTGSPLSGCAVVDANDTSGFGSPNGVKALFTRGRFPPQFLEYRQEQHLALSDDGMEPWSTFTGNPVVVAEAVSASPFHFRDPKVRWFQPATGPGFWIMLVAAFHQVLILRSNDLRTWWLQSTVDLFAPPAALDPDLLTGPMVETPDLLLLPSRDGDEPRWALIYSEFHLTAGPVIGEHTKTWYLFGQFDGSTFRAELDPDQPSPRLADHARRLDVGPDFYAPQSWFEAPLPKSLIGRLVDRLSDAFREIGSLVGLGRFLAPAARPPVIVGWMNNWRYARGLSTDPWAGQMSIARELTWGRTPAGPRILQRPVPALDGLRAGPPVTIPNGTANGTVPIATFAPGTVGTSEWDLRLWFSVGQTRADRVGVRIRSDSHQETVVEWDRTTSLLSLDRRHPSTAHLSSAFWQRFSGRHVPSTDVLTLRILIDRSSVEVFADGGETVLSGLFFPNPSSFDLELFVEGGTAAFGGVRAFPLGPIPG